MYALRQTTLMACNRLSTAWWVCPSLSVVLPCASNYTCHRPASVLPLHYSPLLPQFSAAQYALEESGGGSCHRSATHSLTSLTSPHLAHSLIACTTVRCTSYISCVYVARSPERTTSLHLVGCCWVCCVCLDSPSLTLQDFVWVTNCLYIRVWHMYV